MDGMRSKILFIIVCIILILIGTFCGGCALKMNDITKKHPNGIVETDKSFHLGTNDFSTGKEINLIKVN